MTDPFPQILLAMLAGALVLAAATDLRARRISNRLNAAIALGAPLFWIAMGIAPWPGMAIQVLLGAGAFALFTLAFARGWMGGGDVKLIAALALWLPADAIPALMLAIALLGGAVTLATVIVGAWRKSEGTIEVPYGVAIALAGIWVLGEPYLYLFAR
jgi:prepilin peptidase CpaA